MYEKIVVRQTILPLKLLFANTWLDISGSLSANKKPFIVSNTTNREWISICMQRHGCAQVNN